MKKTLAGSLAAAGVVGAVALAPAPAFAYAPTPTPDSVTVEIGAPVSVSFDPIFEPGATVEITLTGINGNTQGLASVGAVSSTSTSKEADANGGVEAEVTLNSDASGSYELVATDGNVTDSRTITVAGSGAGGTDGSGTDGSGTDAADTDVVGADGAEVDGSGTDAAATDASASDAAGADGSDAETSGTDASGSDEQLAATGPGSIGILVGGAVLLLVGGGFLVARSLRKQKARA